MPRDNLMEMTDAPPPDLLTRLGTALAGQYRIERVLGQGGMGTVFLALDLTLDRPVAIKVISPEVGTSPEIRQRFAQEAKTVARLRQPNIVAVYSAGEADGLLYFVMEYVPGESLRDRLTRERRIPVDDAVRILCDLALALDYAHGASVVHRDVKPENVLLDRESGRAMLTDFGVARAVAGDSRLTGAGFVLGSPRYMSPEQASGESSLDGRSDLYSLGLIGYEMLSGEPAVDAPTAASILVKHLTETPPSLSVKVPGTPPDVARTIARLLEKSPDARFARGAAVAAAFAGEEFDDRTPTHQIGRSNPALRQRSRPPSRRPWAVAAAAAVVALSAGAFWFRTARSTGNDKAWLVAPFEVQGPDRSLDWLRDGSLNMLTLSLAQWNDLHVVEYERTLDLLRDARLDADQRVGLDDARDLARGVGAGRVVMGQVTAIGDSLIVTASLFDVGSGSSTDRARIAALKGSDPRPLFESIATQLLDLVGAPRITIELAKQTTNSVVAYRHYLDGLHALNAWRLRAADSSFNQAIAADSNFALAYYKKSVSMGWEASSDSVRYFAAERAVQLADRLPPRQQELVRGHADLTRAFQAMANGDSAGVMSGFTSSRNRLSQLVASDSTDAEAWYSLADADYHLIWNSPYGRSADSTAKYLSESLRGFKRTIALDSSFHLAYQHLVELYNQAATPRSFLLLVGDTIKPGGLEANERRVGSAGEVDRLRADARLRARTAATGWIASDPDAKAARRVLADSYFDAGQGDSAIVVLQEAMKRPATASAVFDLMIPLIKARTGLSKAGPELKTVMARYTTDSVRALPFGERFQSLMSAMSVGAMTGMPSIIDEAGTKLAQSTPTMPGRASIPTSFVIGWYGNVIKSSMGLPLSSATRTQLLGAIRTMDAFPAGERDAGAPYLLYMGTRDTVFAAAARRWSAQPATAFPELGALLALQRGDSSGAARIAREFPSPDSIRKGQMSMNGARNIARAEVLATLGNARLAVATLETIEPARFTQRTTPEPGWPLYVRSYLMRGRLYEQLGERDKAMASYQQFLSMWADAEAPLQPQLREAREAVARIKESTSVPVKTGLSGNR